jgi:hypothetical protein
MKTSPSSTLSGRTCKEGNQLLQVARFFFRGLYSIRRQINLVAPDRQDGTSDLPAGNGPIDPKFENDR